MCRVFTAPEPLRGRSVGLRLADWAVRSGRAEDLRRRAEARLGYASAEVPARVILAQLALASKDSKRAVDSLDGLRARLEKESVRSAAELACHAALLALESPEMRNGGGCGAGTSP